MTGRDSGAGSHGPGAQSFCEPLWLPGWAERSVWGFDEPAGSYFAQLWPDSDRSEAPAIWIGASGGLVSCCLATEVATATRHDMGAVETALRVDGGATS